MGLEATVAPVSDGSVQSRPTPPSASKKEDLFNQYYPLVKSIARRLAVRMPPSIELDDLLNVGCIGLMNAIDRYSPEREASFTAFVRLRVQGEMIDYLRGLGWIPRTVRDAATRIVEAQRTLETEMGRAPSEMEVADAVGMDIQRYRRIMRSLARQHMVSLEELGGGEEGRDIHQVLEDIKAPNASFQLERSRMLGHISDAVTQLRERQRAVICLYYVEELTLREIGEILGVTEARVCQIRSDAIKALRKRLKGVEPPEFE